ncbi:unnamed protein product [Rotaria sp. Silwood1]|nr:unnamed protein product [Rotaria sp. Silwood1]
MLSAKETLDEIHERFQQLTVWQPSERDPFDELEHWRVNAHTYIEQMYERRQAEVKIIIKEHERAFMRQLIRYRNLLNSLRTQIDVKIKNTQHRRPLSADDEVLLVANLRNIEKEINTELCRGEILVETIPIELDKTVHIVFKTHPTSSTVTCSPDTSGIEQPNKTEQQRSEDAARAFEKWKKTKDQELIAARQAAQNAKLEKLEQDRRKEKQKKQRALISFDQWLTDKKKKGALKKKKPMMNDDDGITTDAGDMS